MNIDWKTIHREALQHFQALIRFQTVNPPGQESLVTDYLGEVLLKEGIEFQCLAAQEGRGNLIARLPSGKSEGPLLLSSHVDVVPVELDKWQYPPFEARIEEGYLWGRGAIDMKHMVTFNLMTLLLFKRLGLPLKRDLIWAAVADEEAGCEHGSRFLVDRHPELIRAEYALNELGGFTVYSGNKRFYPIQIGEKGFVWLKVKATGEAGHGSIPFGDNALVKIARAIERLHKKMLPRHDHPLVESFILSLASGRAFPISLLVKGITQSYGDLILKILPDRDAARLFIALTHNTANPTMLEGGTKINVVPSEAAVLVDGRILPGQNEASFLREIRSILGPGYVLEVMKSHPATECSADTPLFHTLKEVLEERDPGSEAIPYLVAGFTDASAYSQLGIKTYGFSPIQLPRDIVFSKLYHNHNERIPVAGFQWGMETFFEAVRRFCT